MAVHVSDFKSLPDEGTKSVAGLAHLIVETGVFPTSWFDVKVVMTPKSLALKDLRLLVIAPVAYRLFGKILLSLDMLFSMSMATLLAAFLNDERSLLSSELLCSSIIVALPAALLMGLLSTPRRNFLMPFLTLLNLRASSRLEFRPPFILGVNILPPFGGSFQSTALFRISLFTVT